MKISINITKREIEHLKVHSFVDECIEVQDVMRKVQKEINKLRKRGDKE